MTGLQSKFDWEGVAAAGIGGDVGAEVGNALAGSRGLTRLVRSVWKPVGWIMLRSAILAA